MSERWARGIGPRAHIEALERSQGRALREVALGQDGARERLAAIDNQIAALRRELG